MTTKFHSSLYVSLSRVILATILMLSTLVGMAQKEKSKIKNFHIGLVYPISTNGVDAGEYTNKFSLHAFAGYSRAEIGFAGAGFANIVKDSARGVMAAGFTNIVLNTSRGAQLAGFANVTQRETQGFQGAGYFNYAGTLNKGVQLAGFANVSLRGKGGVQAAGFGNMGADVHTQIAGFMNIAKKVKGVQVAGFLNIADSSEYPIGIVNIIRNGEKAISVSVDETSTTLVSFRSGSKRLYGILGAGYNFKGDDPLYAWEAGIGAHFKATSYLRFNVELAGIGLTDFKSGTGEYFKTALRILPALKVGPRLEIFAGPTFNHVQFDKTIGKELMDHYLWDDISSSGDFHGLYIGALAGLQWRL